MGVRLLPKPFYNPVPDQSRLRANGEPSTVPSSPSRVRRDPAMRNDLLKFLNCAMFRGPRWISTSGIPSATASEPRRDAALRGSRHIELSGSNHHPSPSDYAVVCGGPVSFAWNCRFDISSHRGTVLVFEVVHRARDQAATAVAWGESDSRSLLDHFMEKSLSLLARKEFAEP
jgi:hypothetical protein